ncbi:acyl-CoA dehydrogenase family protein [uncultured Sphingomonas sp.]|uniref:acyl-CoA dehydrogenase family protein n=1 Tax=uncultured Sphingomonas sp. TaxID=158754 RepID=UPI0035C9B783
MLTLDNIAGRFACNDEHEAFRQTVRTFLQKEGVPKVDEWERDRLVPEAFWQAAGAIGRLCPTVPGEYCGLGIDFGHNAIVDEEMSYNGVPAGFSLRSDIVADYIAHYGSEEQKAEWLPRMVSGETITAIAMTEPGTGSDLQAIRTTAKKDGNHYVINGSKTYITNGQNTDLTPVVAKTDPDAKPAWRGMSIILVESDREGSRKGRKLDKIGQDAAGTSELFFDDTVAFTKDRRAIARHLRGELTNEEGAAAKLWHTELQWEVMDKCLQLHDGAGYMNEYPIARAWRAARVTRIFGGTSEIMKEVIGRSLNPSIRRCRAPPVAEQADARGGRRSIGTSGAPPTRSVGISDTPGSGRIP